MPQTPDRTNEPRTVVVASTNPVKLAAVERGFARMFPGREFRFETTSVPSGVADQPFSDAETRRGARNRAEEAERRRPDADYWLGLEGGIEDDDRTLTAFAWVAVRSAGRLGESRTATFALPEQIAELVHGGLELGHANDRFFGRTNSKHEEGAVGLLTGGAIDRTELYAPAVTLALIPFRENHEA